MAKMVSESTGLYLYAADFYQVSSCLSQRIEGFAFLWSESLTWVMLQASLNEILAYTDTAYFAESFQLLPVLIGTAEGMHPCGCLLDNLLFLSHDYENE